MNKSKRIYHVYITYLLYTRKNSYIEKIYLIFAVYWHKSVMSSFILSKAAIHESRSIAINACEKYCANKGKRTPI